ncbi:MAG: cyclase family protein [Methanomicrobiales archaeon]
MIIPISYPMNRSSPLYPGTPPMTINPGKSMAAGDPANTSIITISSHAGTHIDAPGHFCPGGKPVSAVLAPETILAPAVCIDLPREGDAPIAAGDLLPFLPGIRDAGALLIRTGMYRLRREDPEMYASRHPWVHPDVPDFLRRHCPNLRLLGLDVISISTPSHREEGRESHRSFLCGSPPILLLEDADLSSKRIGSTSFTLRIYPVVHDDLDGVPVVALAGFQGGAVTDRR